jgi:hypothetical protein
MSRSAESLPVSQGVCCVELSLFRDFLSGLILKTYRPVGGDEDWIYCFVIQFFGGLL